MQMRKKKKKKNSCTVDTIQIEEERKLTTNLCNLITIFKRLYDKGDSLIGKMHSEKKKALCTDGGLTK